MKHIELENELRGHIKKRRTIEAILSAVFLVIAIVFGILYMQSGVVEEISFGPIRHQSVTYNYNFAWGMLVGVLGFIPFVTFWICDYIFSKLVTFEVGRDFVTFYRGTIHTNLYVNGELQDSLSYGFYMEGTLSDGTKINVALGKWSAHLTFSNGQSPIDI